jgi:DNA-binding MarR family transcriptional regulator
MLTPVSEATGTLILDLLGPLCKEGGLFLGDEFKALRFRQAQRLKKITERADEVLKLNGSPVHHPSDSLLLNMIQFASLVDSSILQDHWAMLLAKEASGYDIHPRFPRILADLSPADAQILDTIDQQKYKLGFIVFDLKQAHKVEEAVVQQTIDNLLHLGLLNESPRPSSSRSNQGFRTRIGERKRDEVKGVQHAG